MRRTKNFLFALAVLAALTAILSSAAAFAESAFDHALSLAYEERYRESRLALDPYLQREPGNVRGRILDGILRVHAGERDEAIGIFHELVREIPDSFEASNNLAVLYVDQGRLEDARGVLLAILERRPEVVGYRNLGDIYVRLARRAYARGRELAKERAATHAGSPVPGPPARDMNATAASTTRAATDGLAQTTQASAESSDIASGPHGACLSVGAFRNPRDFHDAQEWLRSHGAEIVDVSSETSETIKDYRVYLPPFESRRSAVKKLQEMKGRGVRDIAVILSGPLKNAVSLGIYAEKNNLEKRVARLGRLGYSVVWEPNSSAVDEYLTIRARANGSPASLRDAWTSQFPTHAMRQSECD